MTFLHLGLAAAGIACVAIPILIHLLMRRRRKPVMWGAMRFLLEAYRRQRKRLMLEQWLLLAARCLLVLLLGLAIARPLLRGLGPAPGGRTVYLLVDNGLASTATTGRGGADDSALARHKAAAERVLAQLAAGAATDVGDRVALITLGGPADPVVVPPSGDLDAVRRLVNTIAPTDSRTDLPGALSLAASSITAERERDGDRARARTVVVVLSDFLEGSADLDAALPKLPDGVTVIASAPPEGRALDNLSIAAVEPLRSLVVAGSGEGSAGAGEQVRVTVRRSGAAVAQAGVVGVRVRVSRPGQAENAAGAFSGTGRGTVRFAAGQEEASGVVPVSITSAGGSGGGDGADERAGPALLEATLDADAVAGDNLWRRPVEVRRSLKVGIVALRRFGDAGRLDQLPAGEWLKLALRPAADAVGADAGAVDVSEIEPGALDVGRLARLDALVLPRPELLSEDMWRRVRGFVDGGGLVMVMPPADVTVHTWADAMTRALGVPWTLAREAAPVTAPGAETPARIVAAPAADDGAGAADVLALLRPELGDLLERVTVFRALPMVFPEGEQAAAGSSERLLMVENGPAILWAGAPRDTEGDGAGTSAAGAPQAGRGLVVYLGTALDLEWTDLPARPLMVPLLQEIVRQGIGRARGSWWGTAGRQAPAPRRAVELVRLEQRPRAGSPGGGDEAAGPATLRVDGTGATAEPVRNAGVWRAVDDRGGDRGVVAVNPDPRAGTVNPRAGADVERWLRSSAGGAGDVAVLTEEQFGRPAAGSAPSASGGALAALLSGEDRGPPVSLPLLIAAAALALVEVVLARWASHAESGPMPSLQGAAA